MQFAFAGLSRKFVASHNGPVTYGEERNCGLDIWSSHSQSLADLIPPPIFPLRNRVSSTIATQSAASAASLKIAQGIRVSPNNPPASSQIVRLPQ